MITAVVREYVQKACQAPENAFGPQFFDQHVCVVADYAVRLAARLGADKETVEIASYLHDISAVLDLKTLPQHPQLSADAAVKFLGENGYPQERIQKVRQSILTHAAPVTAGKGTPEEMCVSNADAISQIVRPAFWCYFMFAIRKASFKDGYEWLRNRVEGNWTAMIPEARDLITDEYQLAKKILAY
jgi:uncharacterized protein